MITHQVQVRVWKRNTRKLSMFSFVSVRRCSTLKSCSAASTPTACQWALKQVVVQEQINININIESCPARRMLTWTQHFSPPRDLVTSLCISWLVPQRWPNVSTVTAQWRRCTRRNLTMWLLVELPIWRSSWLIMNMKRDGRWSSAHLGSGTGYGIPGATATPNHSKGVTTRRARLGTSVHGGTSRHVLTMARQFPLPPPIKDYIFDADRLMLMDRGAFRNKDYFFVSGQMIRRYLSKTDVWKRHALQQQQPPMMGDNNNSGNVADALLLDYDPTVLIINDTLASIYYTFFFSKHNISDNNVFPWLSHVLLRTTSTTSSRSSSFTTTKRLTDESFNDSLFNNKRPEEVLKETAESVIQTMQQDYPSARPTIRDVQGGDERFPPGGKEREHAEKNSLPEPSTSTSASPNSKYFLAYAASNCHGAREAAFTTIFNLFHSVFPELLPNGTISTTPENVEDGEKNKTHPMIHAFGKCHGKYAETAMRDEGKRAHPNNVNRFGQYKFALVMENSLGSGYVTEKIINAFYSGTIPIWYGTREVFDIFHQGAFVYYDPGNPKPALATLKQILLELRVSAEKKIEIEIETMKMKGKDTTASVNDNKKKKNMMEEVLLSATSPTYEAMARAPMLRDGETTLYNYLSYGRPAAVAPRAPSSSASGQQKQTQQTLLLKDKFNCFLKSVSTQP